MVLYQMAFLNRMNHIVISVENIEEASKLSEGVGRF